MEVVLKLFPSTYRVKWDIVGEPKVSILIPNKDHTEDLEKCLHSIWTKTEWAPRSRRR